MSRRKKFGFGLGSLLLLALTLRLWGLDVVFWYMSRPSEWVPVPMEEIDMVCEERTQPVPWSFCVNRTPESDNHDVVYHFHGRRGTARWWNDSDYYSTAVHAAWRAEGSDAPVVVSVSFGPMWLMTDGQGGDGGLLGAFIDSVIPEVESSLDFSPRRRLLVGESMGGLNVLLTALKRPTTFARAAALCAPLSTLSPYADFGDIQDEVGASSTTWSSALMMVTAGQHFFPNETQWRQHDPLSLARQLPATPQAVQLYLTCGARDSWGCMDGSLALVDAARTSGLSVQWVPRPGGHCDIDIESLARFLAFADDTVEGNGVGEK